MVKAAFKIIGVKLPDLSCIFHKRAISKARDDLQLSSSSSGEFEPLPSGRRLPKTRVTVYRATDDGGFSDGILLSFLLSLDVFNCFLYRSLCACICVFYVFTWLQAEGTASA